jgi:hypothetical protein
MGFIGELFVPPQTRLASICFSMANLQTLLATSAEVSALSREEIASYILESLNAEAPLAAGGRVHTRNYMRAVKESYHDDEIVSKVQSAWRWAADNE